MADFDQNCDQIGNALPTYDRSGAEGLNIEVISETSYVEPVTVNEFKDHAYIDSSTNDDQLALILKSARISVEEHLEKSLGIRTMRITALRLPKNYRLPFGPVDSVTTSGFTLFGGMVREGGTDVTIEYVTKASLVNDTIKEAIYKQAYHNYENRDSKKSYSGQLVDEAEMMLMPFKRGVFL